MLNKEQKEAYYLISRFIDYNNNGVFGLLGAGGTGKTYLITSLPDVDNYQFLAPTNKVVNLLRQSLIKNGVIKPNVKTIDSFFKFKINKNELNESVYSYTQPKEKDLPSVIIVDEVSLLKNKHIELLLNLNKKVSLIFLGDDKQIPPIEEEEKIYIDEYGFQKSKAFDVLTESFTLTIQERQEKDSKMYDLINGFRNGMEKYINFKKLISEKNNNKDILYVHQNSNELKEIIKNKECVAITFKNNTVDLFNYKIGSIKTNNVFYNLKDINIGDELIFKSFYRNEKVNFYTSEKIKIINIDLIKIDVKIPFCNPIQDYFLKVATVKNETGFDKEIWLNDSVLKTKVREKIYRKRNQLKLELNYGDEIAKKNLCELNTFYYDFKHKFAELKKPYAMTSHTSQGSTYENIIIPVYDFYKKKHQDANQLFYVAMSRAKKSIIFVDGYSNFNNRAFRVTFTEEERCLVASMQNWKCNLCSIELNDGRYDIDHIEPLGKFDRYANLIGTNNLYNLQALCKECHKIKTKNDKYGSI